MTLVTTKGATGEGQEPLCRWRKRHVSLGSSHRGKADSAGGYPPRAPRASAAACQTASQGKALGR
jgi:hypothetical protein